MAQWLVCPCLVAHDGTPYSDMDEYRAGGYNQDMRRTTFEWDPAKDVANQRKHGVPFAIAQFAFADPRRVIAADLSHSAVEDRFYCFGQVEGGVMTVRFTHRKGAIRILGAGYWRRGKRIYEQANPLHR
jgi:uncharacterized DUF497 family protein